MHNNDNLSWGNAWIGKNKHRFKQKNFILNMNEIWNSGELS